jgi:uncharacterized iron-regulated membrane protein
MKPALRRAWLRVHLYLGLAAGGLFAVLGLSGSALVFYLELDTLLNPQIAVVQPAVAPSPDAVLQRLQALHPERDGPWRIEMPLAPDRPLMVRYYNPPETAGRGFAPLMLTLDPVTLAETSHRFWGDYAMTWLYDLHYTLLAGPTGRSVVGWSGVLLLVSLLTGLALWWPGPKRLKAALKPVLRKGPVRLTYDLHVLGGIYGLVVLLALAFTGMVLALPEIARPLVAAASPLEPGFRAPAGLVGEGEPPLSLDAALEIARQVFPDAELRWVETSGVQGRPISLRFYRAGEPGRRFARNQVWIDPGTGAILAVRDTRQDSAGDRFMDWMHPLHNGEAFGLAGRALAVVGGLLPAVLLVTGWLRWRHKRAARQLTAVRRAAAA